MDIQKVIMRMMSVFTAVWSTSSVAQANPLQPNNRYYNHGLVRLVTPKIEQGRIVLWWWAPSGQRFVFTPTDYHKGWLARLRHAILDNVQYIAAGGYYFQTHSNRGWVRLSLVKRVRRVFRGVRPVKFDGRMPIYLATVLPRNRTDRLYVYKLWGRVSLHQENFNNKVVCLYGDWFDFQDRALGLVSQIRGIKGSVLQTFPQQYQYNRDWDDVWRRRKHLLTYQERIRLHKPAPFPAKVAPLLPEQETKSAHQRCRSRINRLEKKIATPLDHLYEWEWYQNHFASLPVPHPLFAFPGTFSIQIPGSYWSHGKAEPHETY